MASTTFSSPAFPADAPWRGIWKGVIGGQQVMVCLDAPDDSSEIELEITDVAN